MGLGAAEGTGCILSRRRPLDRPPVLFAPRTVAVYSSGEDPVVAERGGRRFPNITWWHVGRRPLLTWEAVFSASCPQLTRLQAHG